MTVSSMKMTKPKKGSRPSIATVFKEAKASGATSVLVIEPDGRKIEARFGGTDGEPANKNPWDAEVERLRTQ